MKTTPLSRQKNGRQHGIAIIEFAFVLPMLLILLLTVSEFGRALYQSNALHKAVRDSARYLSRNPDLYTGGQSSDPLDTTVTAAARNMVRCGKPASCANDGSEDLIRKLDTPVTIDIAAGPIGHSGTDPGNSADCDDGLNADPNYVIVCAEYRYQPIFGSALADLLQGIGDMDFTIRASAVMRRLL